MHFWVSRLCRLTRRANFLVSPKIDTSRGRGGYLLVERVLNLGFSEDVGEVFALGKLLGEFVFPILNHLGKIWIFTSLTTGSS